MHRTNVKPTHKIVLFIVIVIIIWLVYNVIKCDQSAQNELVTTPEGETIMKYNLAGGEIPFGKLVDECNYKEKKIVCKDVRRKGEYMNRQSNLAIARMHAVFHLICKRFEIQYWILSGSLLAAKRNGILIPWDTDGDVGMLLEDYKKLLKYIRLELPEDLYFQDSSDNPAFKRNVCNAKLRDRNSCYGHCLRTGCKWHDGLQMDIFVFEPSEKDPSILTSHFGKHSFLKSDLVPTKPIVLEGVTMSGPASPHNVLTELYGKDYITPPKKQCTYAGFTAIPWYSCDFVRSLSVDKRTKIITDSMDHHSWWYWYFG